MPNTAVLTLSRHIIERERKVPEATGKFTNLLFEIAMAAKIVSQEVNKAGLVNIIGRTGKTNVYGEEVQKLDELAHETFFSALDHTGLISVMSSEEEEQAIPVPKQFPTGKYVINYDPLDGSSNIAANVSIGTIFSIHTKISGAERGTEEDCMQPGKKQVCAGYVIYGSSTMLVYTAGNGVYGFTLDPGIGEFLLSHPDIKFPDQENSKNNFSINICNYGRWNTATRHYVDYIISKKDKPRYTHRYIGSLVADFHRNLLYGGVYLYPADDKNSDGKLRLLCEAAPMSFIAEQAGGKGSTGTENILDIQPNSLQQRVPLVVGAKYEVERYEKFARECEREAQTS